MSKKLVLLSVLTTLMLLPLSGHGYPTADVLKNAKVRSFRSYNVSYDKLFIGEISEISPEGLTILTTYTNVDSTPNYTSAYTYNSKGVMNGQEIEIYTDKAVIMKMKWKITLNENGDQIVDSVYTADTLSSTTSYINEYKDNKLVKQTTIPNPPSYFKKMIQEFNKDGKVTKYTLIGINDMVDSKTEYYYSPNGNLDSILEFDNRSFSRSFCNHDTLVAYPESCADTLKRFDTKKIYEYNSKGQVVKETFITLIDRELFYWTEYFYNDQKLVTGYKQYDQDKKVVYEMKYRYAYY